MKSKIMQRAVISMWMLLSALFCIAESDVDQRSKLKINIDQIVSSDYPVMTAYVVIRNENGELVTGLAPGLFTTRIDAQDIKAKIEITPFSMKEEPVDYTVLISNNGIMEGEPLDFQKTAVMHLAEMLQKSDTLSVYTIGEEAGAVIELATKDSFDPALINEVAISTGQPRLYDSIIHVIRKISQRTVRRKAVIVLSDGRDQGSRYTKEQMENILLETGIPVYTVGMKILSAQSLSNLDQMAELTGATYFYSSTVKKIPDYVKNARDLITKCYVIQYKVKSVKADNAIHLLEISVDERDSFGRGEKTFVAVKLPVPRWLQILLVVIAVLILALLIVLFLFRKMKRRKSMGITRRRCPECNNLMKDSWDYCPFCKYMPEIKKKKKK